MKYYKRIVEDTIESKLKDESIINIVGPRECGKTTVAEIFANSSLSIEDDINSYELLSELKPEVLLQGEKPLLIHDIERVPLLKDELVKSSKKISNNGLFITTNSQATQNTILMYPMSLYESGNSVGDIKIMDFFKYPDLNIDGFESQLELEELIDVTCRGGFPKAINNPHEIGNYIDRVIIEYIPSINGSKRNYDKIQTMLRIYSDNIYTFTKNSEIVDEISKIYPNFAKSTYYNYLNELKDLHIIDEIPAWRQQIKSQSAIKSISKKGFCDPSIPIYLLDLNHNDLLYNLEKFEYFFKNLCYRDLKIYTSKYGGKISYYGDRYGGEVDCILEFDNGDYALINFNLGSSKIDKSIKQLLKIDKFIERKINQGKLSIKKPKFLSIVTATRFAYTHKSGVKIIPIGVLK